MNDKKLFEITFKGREELIKIAEQKRKLLEENVTAAVARTVLWGAARIAESCPVDTGRLRSSILGYLAQKFGLALEGDMRAVASGLSQSVTEANGYRGRIGTTVNYALMVDLGITGGIRERKPLTPKQLRYLFYKGILKRGPGKSVIYTYKAKGKRGKGFFRNNIPIIDNYFQEQMYDAIQYTERDELMPITF